MTTAHVVETFNTHRMSDEVIRALVTGRENELAAIIPAIRQAAAAPGSAAPAMIVYGERGSGKSFLMRLVQMACADIQGIACVLLPEEQYNLRMPQQLLQIVTAHIRGDDWSGMAWYNEQRSEADAWAEDLQALHVALDARFGSGQGLAVVLLENFDSLTEKLFGATPPAKSGKSSAGGQALARRQAEERLRKLMNARHGRFMLIASASGTVDMDYERPLFQAFTPVDIHSWSVDSAISYFNKRRALAGQGALAPTQEARARAIVEFISGNPRLAQLLGDLLTSPDPRSIANTLDALADHLADYYRQRLDALPPAAAAVLDALIRSGEPASQTELARRMQYEQRQIADAFSFLLRIRLLRATSERGGASQLYQVRDRLFVHFYRRRYGNISGLAAIAELLEHFYTPDERERQIHQHLTHGEFDDARAFGHLPLDGGSIEHGFCGFRDRGITAGPARYWFTLAGLTEPEVAASRAQLRMAPDQAYRHWIAEAGQASQTGDWLRYVAAQVLAAVAISRNGQDRMAQSLLNNAVAQARLAKHVDALIIALDAMSIFFWHRPQDQAKDHAITLALCAEAADLLPQANHANARVVAYRNAALHAYHTQRYTEAEVLARTGLGETPPPDLHLSLLYRLAWALLRQGRHDEALHAWNELLQLARQHGSLDRQLDALWASADILTGMERDADALAALLKAEKLAAELGNVKARAQLLFMIGWQQEKQKEFSSALANARQSQTLALGTQPPDWVTAANSADLATIALLDQNKPADAAQAALAGLTFAQHTDAKETTCLLLDKLIYTASFIPLPTALAALAQELARDADLPVFAKPYVVTENWLSAVGRCQDWASALALAQCHPPLLQATDDVWVACLTLTGKAWADAVQSAGRASAYAQASAALPHIKTLFDLRPPNPGQDAGARLAGELGDLVAELTQHCSEPGFLRDLADLLPTQFGTSASEAAKRLREFAALHEAPDKEIYLQRLDPDLAFAMRRIWNLPEPQDTLTKRGRVRAR